MIAGYKIRCNNLLYDFRDFIKENRGKLWIMAALQVLAIVLGVRAGFSVADAGEYLQAHSTTEFLYLQGRKGIFGYFFVKLLCDVVILVLLALTSSHFILSYLGFAILFFRAYIFALYISLYIIFLKLAVLPFVILCMLPCFLLGTLLFCSVTALAFCRAHEAWRYGHGCHQTFLRFVRSLFFPCAMLILLQILCTILTYFLTLGIIL